MVESECATHVRYDRLAKGADVSPLSHSDAQIVWLSFVTVKVHGISARVAHAVRCRNSRISMLHARFVERTLRYAVDRVEVDSACFVDDHLGVDLS